MFESIDKSVCRIIRSRAHEALQQIASDMGMDVSVSGGKFNDLKYSTRFEFSIRENKDGKSGGQVEFERYAPTLGLSADDFEKTIETAGKTFKLVGIKPSRSKYPIIAEHVGTGKHYKFPAGQVRILLNK